MEEWKKRLKAAREAAGLNKTAFAKAIGVSNPTVTDWEKSVDSGGIQEIAGVRLTKICEVLNISPGQLLHGRDASNGNFAGAKTVYVAEEDDPSFVEIPMVKLRLQAGHTGFQTEPEEGDGKLGMRREWVEKNGFDPTSLIVTQVRGESMEPTLYEDDIVVINLRDKKLVDGKVYAFNYEGEAVVKRLSRDAGEWWLTSDNSDQRKYHRKICRGDACLVIGKVVHKESDRI